MPELTLRVLELPLPRRPVGAAAGHRAGRGADAALDAGAPGSAPTPPGDGVAAPGGGAPGTRCSRCGQVRPAAPATRVRAGALAGYADRRGLYIAHPLGCVLHAERIGTNVTIIGQVTFGYRGGAWWPVIGDEAYIGVGARVLGGIRVGDRAKIGANAVALDDVPDDASVVGIPARVIARHTNAEAPR